MEIWKSIKDTNEKYQVSSHGRVRSDDRILKCQEDAKGYMRVSITVNRVKKTHKVHRLVAEAFIDGKTHMANQVNHIDGDKRNNRSDNLEWVSCKENIRHSIDTGISSRYRPGNREYNESRKKPIVATNVDTGKEITFGSIAEAERYFNSRHISAVLKGKRKKAINHSFAYIEGGDAK